MIYYNGVPFEAQLLGQDHDPLVAGKHLRPLGGPDVDPVVRRALLTIKDSAQAEGARYFTGNRPDKRILPELEGSDLFKDRRNFFALREVTLQYLPLQVHQFFGECQVLDFKVRLPQPAPRRPVHEV